MPFRPSRYIRKIIGPEQIDQQIRMAIQLCWVMLPKETKSIDEVEKQIRQLMDRALADFREDFDAYGGQE